LARPTRPSRRYCHHSGFDQRHERINQGLMTITLHTVGHSDRSLEELLELLRSAGIRTVVDVRQRPSYHTLSISVRKACARHSVQRVLTIIVPDGSWVDSDRHGRLATQGTDRCGAAGLCRLHGYRDVQEGGGATHAFGQSGGHDHSMCRAWILWPVSVLCSQTISSCKAWS